MDKLLVIDGNSIVNRAFYGIKLLTTKDGAFTNAIYGFLTMMKRILDDVQPNLVGIAFDVHAPTFRHQLYADYKGQRKGMPPELAAQMAPLKEILRNLGYVLIECPGFEADDILGTLAAKCAGTGTACVIATGDRDSLQLVSENTSVRLLSTKMGQPQTTVYDVETVRETYGVLPPQLIEIKAIQGDTSDNIPGVAGIGPKGAGELIQRFGSLDGVYAHIEDVSIKAGTRQKLLQDKENAYLSRTLGTIRTDAPIDTVLVHYAVGAGDKPAAVRRMASLELFSLIEKLDLQHIEAASAAAEETPAVVLAAAQRCDLNKAEALLQDGELYLYPVYRQESMERLLLWKDGSIYELPTEEEALCRYLSKAKGKICLPDSKLYYKALLRAGVPYEQIGTVSMDTTLAAYLLNPSAGEYSLPRLAAEYSVPVPQCADTDEEICTAALLPGVCAALRAKIAENGQEQLLSTMELPFARVLAEMELAGFSVNKEGIAAFGEELAQRLAQSEQRIYEQVGYVFNINSPKQLGEALFGKLGLSHGKKTKSGYSTNADVLEEIRYEHPVVEEILQYRTVSKLKSTYCDGLLKVIAADGRIHSSFNQTETRTGRISSTEPNLQNIPVRGDLGRELRRFFTARPGWVLVDADYSQIELRVLAHVADDKNMIASFCEGKDIHASTAAKVFHMPEELVTPLLRSRAKAVNFGIVYGIGAFSLSKDIGTTRKEADTYIKEYLENFSGVRDYMDRTVQSAKENGYVETVFGRRRYLPELQSSNFNLRAFGERVARNMPIQGTAADIIKVAMIGVNDRLHREGLTGKLILQVHDELIVECPQEESERVKTILEEEMQQAIALRVPLTAEAQMGENWLEAHS